jgi:hypothetical protein
MDLADFDALGAATGASDDPGAALGFAGLGQAVGEAAQGGGGDHLIELVPAAPIAAFDVAVGVELVEPDHLVRR